MPSVQSTTHAKDASRRQRNIGNAYTVSSLLQSETRMDDVLRNLKSYFSRIADSANPVELGEIWAWAAFDVLGEITFSTRFGFLDAGEDIGGAIAGTEGMMVYGSAFGYALPLHKLIADNPVCRAFNRWLAVSERAHLSKIAAGAMAKRRGDPDASHDMVGIWFKNLAASKHAMTPGEITAGGGSETISATLQSMIYHLVKTPHALRLAQKEIDAADLSEISSHAEVAKLPYLQACLREALLMHPAGPWNLPRVAPNEGLVIGGEYFPRGTVLSVNPWVIHHHPNTFKRPESFEPERWLDDENRKQIEGFWIPFGVGYNRCPGRQLALIEVPKMVALMLRDFEFIRASLGKEWVWRNNFIALPKGWECYVKSRRVTAVAAT